MLAIDAVHAVILLLLLLLLVAVWRSFQQHVNVRSIFQLHRTLPHRLFHARIVEEHLIVTGPHHAPDGRAQQQQQSINNVQLMTQQSLSPWRARDRRGRHWLRLVFRRLLLRRRCRLLVHHATAIHHVRRHGRGECARCSLLRFGCRRLCCCCRRLTCCRRRRQCLLVLQLSGRLCACKLDVISTVDSLEQFKNSWSVYRRARRAPAASPTPIAL